MSVAVHDSPSQNRYEVYDGTELAGFSAYKLTAGRIAFIHTQVYPEFGGRGLAKQLVTAELDDARRRGLAVLPFCPYVQTVIAENAAAYLDLVPESERARFGLAAEEIAEA